ncbi:Peroxiredoxin Q [Abeliophyllum distichum]|uniref:Peroxiredoxin Q, chloroplastic n=1 Tax=Abeliophyllum distichum TaxID=126358 RepID=A0ABD1R2L6_9LAMI
MASFSLPTYHTLPSLLHYHTPKATLSQNPSLLPKSSQSQFHGLKLYNSSPVSIPSSSYVKGSIVAKVHLIICSFSLILHCGFSNSSSRMMQRRHNYVSVDNLQEYRELILDQRDSKSLDCQAPITEGSLAPAFTLKDQDGKTVSLSKFKGKPVVVYFYPADESPSCTKQACAFRDSYEKFKKAGAEVIGISGDDPSSHKAFKQKNKLPFTLLSDEGNKIRKEWGVPADLFGALPGRQTYVLDKNGVVRLVYNNQFQPEKHIDETLKFLQSV